MTFKLADLIERAECPNCGHRVLACHSEKCRWRPASDSPATQRAEEASPMSMVDLLGPECDCGLSDAEALTALLHNLAAEWALEKFTRLCHDRDWVGQEPSLGFQATYSQFLVEDL